MKITTRIAAISWSIYVMWLTHMTTSQPSQRRSDCASNYNNNKAAKGAKGKPLDWLSLSGGQLRSGQIRSGYIYYCIATAKCLSWICVDCLSQEATHGLCMSGWPTICLSEGCLIRPGEGNRIPAYMYICVTYTQAHKSIIDWKLYSLRNGIYSCCRSSPVSCRCFLGFSPLTPSINHSSLSSKQLIMQSRNHKESTVEIANNWNHFNYKLQFSS